MRLTITFANMCTSHPSPCRPGLPPTACSRYRDRSRPAGDREERPHGADAVSAADRGDHDREIPRNRSCTGAVLHRHVEVEYSSCDRRSTDHAETGSSVRPGSKGPAVDVSVGKGRHPAAGTDRTGVGSSNIARRHHRIGDERPRRRVEYHQLDRLTHRARQPQRFVRPAIRSETSESAKGNSALHSRTT